MLNVCVNIKDSKHIIIFISLKSGKLCKAKKDIFSRKNMAFSREESQNYTSHAEMQPIFEMDNESCVTLQNWFVV